MADPLVYIILLNFNNATDTIVCLESLKLVNYENMVITIVDNHSSDGSLREIRSWVKDNFTHGGIDFVELKDNYGFSGGNNAGIKHAITRKADYIMILNNDTMVTPNFLKRMVRTAEHDAKIGVVGCVIRHFPDTGKIWYSGGFIDYLRGYGRHHKVDFCGEKETEFVTGCLMLFPRAVLEKVGMFDDKYFLISEDSDLSYRIRKAGYKLVVSGDTAIFHKVSSTAGGHYSPIIQYYFHRNRMVFLSGVLPAPLNILFVLFQIGVVAPAWSVAELLKGKADAVAWAWRGYIDFLQGRTGKRGDLHKPTS